MKVKMDHLGSQVLIFIICITHTVSGTGQSSKSASDPAIPATNVSTECTTVFRANSDGSSGEHYDGKLAEFPDSTALVIWSYRWTDDGFPYDYTYIFGRYLDKGGIPINDPQNLLNDGAGIRDVYKSVSLFSDGTWIMGWRFLTGYETYNYYLRRYNKDGTAAGNVVVPSNPWVEDIVALSNGGYVILISPPPGHVAPIAPQQIHAQQYDANDNPVGSTLLVSDLSGRRDAMLPVGIETPGGGLAVVWSEFDPYTSYDTNYVYARFYNENGNPYGNSIPIGNIDMPKKAGITTVDANTVAFCWIHNQQIYLHYYLSTGIPISSPIPVGEQGTNKDVRITAISNGSVVVAWSDRTNNSIKMQIFDTDQSPIGNVTPVWSPDDDCYFGYYGDLQPTAAGGFALLWYQQHVFTYGSSEYIHWDWYRQAFDSLGSPLSDPVMVTPEEGANDQKNPAIAALDSTTYAVAWSHYHRGKREIQFQRFSGKANRIGQQQSVVELADTSFDPHPDISSNLDGEMIIVWDTGEEPESHIYGGIYTSNTDTSEGIFRIDDYETSHKSLPSITYVPSAGYLTLWHDNRGTRDDIYAQQISSDGMLLGPNIRLTTDTVTIMAS
jgi:hypothetical protein